jgi:hypothetical protein
MPREASIVFAISDCYAPSTIIMKQRYVLENDIFNVGSKREIQNESENNVRS